MMNKKKKKRYRSWPFIIGTLCIIAAVALFMSNRHEDAMAGKQAEALLQEIHEVIPTITEPAEHIFSGYKDSEVYIPDYILNPDMKMPEIEIDGNLYIGTLYFPALDLELPVMSSWSYPGLKVSPCLYAGSVYKGNAVIAAHNYESHFGRLSVLEPGDTVVFIDANGNVFNYEVIVQEVLAPTAIDAMLDNDADLSLFTCTIGGASRFTVRCRLLETPRLL